MNGPVAFGLALSSSFPSGTGSYNYKGSFAMIVQNLAFEKQVSIWAREGGVWKDIPASYSQSLPGNLELWTAPANNSEGQFAAKYEVEGTVYWDNNNWANYLFPQAFDEFAALSGKDFPVALGNASLTAPNLYVDVAVQNLAYAKDVGMVYTVDDWASAHVAYGAYGSTMKSGLEVWNITAPIGSAGEVKFALFYRVAGAEYWDNNFTRNYRITPGRSLNWADAP